MAELIESKKSFFLHFHGFLYYKHSGKIGMRAYWRCRRTPECGARAVTDGGPNDLHVAKYTPDDEHTHAPNIEEVIRNKKDNS